MADAALIDVDLSTLGEVEVFGPSVDVVADEFYGSMAAISTSTIFPTVENVLASDVPQDDCSFEDLFQLSYVIDRGAGFVDSLFPLLDLMSPRGRKSLASQSARKVLHNSLSHTVEVTIS